MVCFPLLFPKPYTVSLVVNNTNTTEVEFGNGTSHSKQDHGKLKVHKINSIPAEIRTNWYHNLRQISLLLSHSQLSWNKKAVFKLSSNFMIS